MKVTFLTIVQVAEQYEWSEKKVYSLCHCDGWKPFAKQVSAKGKRNSGRWKICKEMLDEWILNGGN